MSEQETQEVQEAPKAKLSALLRSISQLLMHGSFPGTHAQIIVQSIGVLELLASSEEKKELEAEPKLEVVPDQVEEEEKVHVQDGV